MQAFWPLGIPLFGKKKEDRNGKEKKAVDSIPELLEVVKIRSPLSRLASTSVRLCRTAHFMLTSKSRTELIVAVELTEKEREKRHRSMVGQSNSYVFACNISNVEQNILY
ncbi:hypothetical protein CEXT_303891 [Caerostris extrusa]|uniref:Uncharacterized protein n=1 Tax=Caerostris extrusa TaxID=172846 RepID=A0AAV4SHM7_CAEEX|nr:hypothetical protein CEXT_303891 [Caerostris extrusa]